MAGSDRCAVCAGTGFLLEDACPLCFRTEGEVNHSAEMKQERERNFDISVVNAVSGEKLLTLPVKADATIRHLRSEIRSASSQADSAPRQKILFNGMILNDETMTLEDVGLYPGAEICIVKSSLPSLVAVTHKALSRWDMSTAEPSEKCIVEKTNLQFNGLSDDGQRAWLEANLFDTYSGQILTKVRSSGFLSPDGGKIAFITGCDEDGLNICDVGSRDVHTVRTRSMDHIAFSQDSKFMLVVHCSCGRIQMITTWSLHLHMMDSFDFDDAEGFEDELADGFVLLSSDGSRLVATVPVEPGHDRKLVLRVLGGAVFENATGPACLSSSGDHVLAAMSTGGAALFDINSGEKLVVMHGSPASTISCVSMSKDETLAATGHVSGSLQVWDAESGVCLLSIALSDPVKALAFATDLDSQSLSHQSQLTAPADTTSASADTAPVEEVVAAPATARSPGGIAKKTAIVVRTCAPTNSMVARFAVWAADLSANPFTDMHVSIDATHDEDNHYSEQVRKHLGETAGVHTYTDEELTQQFPMLIDLAAIAPTGDGMKQGTKKCRPLGKGFRCEAMALWRKSLLHPGAYDYVWVIEDDVGFSGGILDFISVHETDDADLISGPRREKIEEGSDVSQEGWNCYHVCSTEYHQRAVERYVTDEFIQRFSRNLLDELDSWVKSGASAWSQQMSVSVCHAAGMSWRPLQKDAIGHAWSWCARVSEEEWHEICKAVEDGKDRGRCFHALKF